MQKSLQNKIISFLKVKPAIIAEEEIQNRIDFLYKFLENTAASGFVLAISGGQDSTLAGILAAKAVDKYNNLNRSQKSLYLLKLPYNKQADIDDANSACAFIQSLCKTAKIYEINIANAVDAAVNDFEGTLIEKCEDFNKGNLKARIRMVYQYLFAGRFNALVIGTDHASEAVLGFFTKWGDGACDIVPLYGLTKFQGKELLKALECPKKLYLKTPTADLLDNNPGMPDEKELGISYKDIESYLMGKNVNSQAKRLIESKYLATRHKRSMPSTPD